ncbi:hypothetical protein B0H11DRAFT_2203761 [Mycena galericulata]|nr:hypothetical protein B0H11DRAFT_2203761 [Mycena galericulata]
MPPRRKQHIVGASKHTSGRTRRDARAYKTPRREPAPLAEPAPAPAGAADPHPVPTEDFNAMCFDLTLGSENHAHRTSRCSGNGTPSSVADVDFDPGPRGAGSSIASSLSNSVHRTNVSPSGAWTHRGRCRRTGEAREGACARCACVTQGACERHGAYVIPLLGWAVQRRGRRANGSAAPLHHCKYVGKLAGSSARCHELATQGISTGFAAAAENVASSVGATAELTFLSSIQQIRGSGARFWRPSHERTRTTAIPDSSALSHNKDGAKEAGCAPCLPSSPSVSMVLCGCGCTCTNESIYRVKSGEIMLESRPGSVEESSARYIRQPQELNTSDEHEEPLGHVGWAG